MAKKLKIWNGRGQGHPYEGHHVFVAAYSQKQAAELVGQVFGHSTVGVGEIANYFSAGCWGRTMDGIIPTEPCVYLEKNYAGIPFRVL